MRVAILSDIHGNLEALEAFIDHAADLNLDDYVCLGDIVGYGANPNDCFDRLDNLPQLRTLLGNPDACAMICWVFNLLSLHHIKLSSRGSAALIF